MPLEQKPKREAGCGCALLIAGFAIAAIVLCFTEPLGMIALCLLAIVVFMVV